MTLRGHHTRVTGAEKHSLSKSLITLEPGGPHVALAGNLSRLHNWEADAWGLLEERHGTNAGESGDFRMSASKRILLVDDDEVLVQSLAEQLDLHEDFDTVGLGSAAGALTWAKDERFDLIILDVGLPDMDGREVCRALRRAGVETPIIMLASADSDADTILGLDFGANDYVTKPFRFGVLLTLVRAQLRQHEQSEDAVFTIGPYSFRPSAKMLVDDARNQKVRLTEKETSILKYLYGAGENVVPRDKLLDEVWGYNAGVTTHTLETHIYRLRKKIKADPSSSELLVTAPGGYRLVP